jgi:hypothetical protein
MVMPIGLLILGTATVQAKVMPRFGRLGARLALNTSVARHI